MTTRKRALKKAKLRHAEYYDFQAVQDGLYKDSGDGKEFHNLIEIIVMPENIRMAYRNLKKNPGSHTPGTDRKTINDIEKLTDEQLISKIQGKFRWYRPQSVRRVEIPKGDGKFAHWEFQQLWTDWCNSAYCKFWSLFVKQSSMNTVTDSGQTEAQGMQLRRHIKICR